MSIVKIGDERRVDIVLPPGTHPLGDDRFVITSSPITITSVQRFTYDPEYEPACLNPAWRFHAYEGLEEAAKAALAAEEAEERRRNEESTQRWRDELEAREIKRHAEEVAAHRLIAARRRSYRPDGPEVTSLPVTWGQAWWQVLTWPLRAAWRLLRRDRKALPAARVVQR